MKQITIFVTFLLFVIIELTAFPAAPVSPGAQPDEPVYTELTDAGKKIQLDENHYLIYGFSEKPKIGFIVLKTQCRLRFYKEVFRRFGMFKTPLL